MSTAQVSIFFALLALSALALAVVTVVATVVLRHDERRFALQPLLIPMGFVIAAVSTAGSLYYSEVAGFTPCLYCWYQRICMYPLAGILGVAAIRRDQRVGWYVLPIAIGGLGLSIYHYQLERFPDQGSACDAAIPCSFKWVDEFGFVSIPFMAGSGFIAIIALVTAALVWSRRPAEADDLPVEVDDAPVDDALVDDGPVDATPHHDTPHEVLR